VCGSTVGHVLHHQTLVALDELNAQSDVNIVACARCGLGFADIHTSQVELDETYEKHSKYADTSLYAGEQIVNAPPDAPWDMERLRGTADFLAGSVGNRTARVLDVGCATGTFLGFMGELGYRNLTGLDPSPVATQTARALHRVDTITGSFTTLPATAGPFDLITLQHVLEHLADVRIAVQAMRRLLDDGGLAYVEVPDAERYADFLVAPVHDFNTEHINHFSLELLDRTMASEGFTAVSLGRKEVRCSATDLYPVAFGLWRKGGAAVPLGDRRDDALAQGLRRYVSASADLMRAFDQHLRSELAGADSIAIWGVGQLAMKLLHDTVLGSTRIAAVVDGSPQKHGMHVGGHRVESPQALSDLLAAPHPPPVVVTSIHHQEAILANVRAVVPPGGKIVTLPRPDLAEVSLSAQN
jgi:SAM-dependent methyltransferase